MILYAKCFAAHIAVRCWTAPRRRVLLRAVHSLVTKSTRTEVGFTETNGVHGDETKSERNKREKFQIAHKQTHTHIHEASNHEEVRVQPCGENNTCNTRARVGV